MDLINIKWNKDTYRQFNEYLWSIQDKVLDIEKHSKILNIPKEKLIGIKTPALKNIAKGDYNSFLSQDINDIYEEKVIKGLVISYLKELEYEEIEKYLNEFYNKYVDSWAVCDIVISNLKVIKKYKKEYFKFIKNFYLSSNPWLIRIELVSFIVYYYDDEYIDEVFSICKKITNQEYYVKMGLAWLISVLFIKQRERTIYFLKNNRNSLDTWTYNKAIQKITESFRVSKEDKEFVRSLKIKI